MNTQSSSSLLTHSGVVEHGGQHQKDVVGPVFPVERHFMLLDHQNVQVLGPLHGVVDVEQAVLLTARGGCEDGTFQHAGLLSQQTEQHGHFKTTCAIKKNIM